MEKMKKICLCAAAVAGTAEIAGISAKAVEGMRKKWFLRGFEAGQFIGNLTAAESFAREKTWTIVNKVDRRSMTSSARSLTNFRRTTTIFLRTTTKNNQL